MATVLIIDADFDFLNSMHQLLSGLGYGVLRANDGPSAIRLLDEHRELIDLAIVDLALPGMDGPEMIGAVAGQPDSLKVIATTGVYRKSQLDAAGALGAHTVILKAAPGSPLPARKWSAAVQELIGTSNKFARAAGAKPVK
jgi:CheY-like chemotaxis protein